MEGDRLIQRGDHWELRSGGSPAAAAKPDGDPIVSEVRPVASHVGRARCRAIIDAVCAHHGTTRAAIMGDDRAHVEVVAARRDAWLLLLRRSGLSLRQVADYLGRKPFTVASGAGAAAMAERTSADKREDLKAIAQEAEARTRALVSTRGPK